MHKKGDIGYGLYMVIGIATLALILIFFSVIFFVLGIAKSETSAISGADYKDSSLLLNVLRTEIIFENNKMTIADSFNYLSERNLVKIKNEINNILSLLPKPKNKAAYWILEVNKDNKSIFKSLEPTILGDSYLEQELTLPLKTKEIITIKLYLLCKSCSEEEIEVLS